MADNTFKRYELKYMLDREQYEQIMSEMIRYMQPDRFAHSQIINIYFDTPSHRLIRDSIEKPVYKEKLRLRSYGVPDDDSEVLLSSRRNTNLLCTKEGWRCLNRRLWIIWWAASRCTRIVRSAERSIISCRYTKIWSLRWFSRMREIPTKG